MTPQQAERMIEEACRPGRAMIITEYASGAGSNVWLGGDLIGMLHSLCAVIKRLSDKMGCSTDQILEDMHECLSWSKEKPEGKKNGTLTNYEEYSQELTEYIKEQVTERMERKYGFTIRGLQKEQERLNSEINARDASIKALKEKIEAVRRAGDADKAQLQRELRKKEQEIRKLLKEREERLAES